jgi:hypothetical protein
MKNYAHGILEMNQVTISELRNYKSPKPIVHDVMKATFTLLGERQEMLEVHIGWKLVIVLFSFRECCIVVSKVRTYSGETFYSGGSRIPEGGRHK